MKQNYINFLTSEMGLKFLKLQLFNENNPNLQITLHNLEKNGTSATASFRAHRNDTGLPVACGIITFHPFFCEIKLAGFNGNIPPAKRYVREYSQFVFEEILSMNKAGYMRFSAKDFHRDYTAYLSHIKNTKIAKIEQEYTDNLLSFPTNAEESEN